MSVRRLPLVGVMGSGTYPHSHLSEPLGRWLASLPVHLLTGGGGGVMSAVSGAFARVEGRSGGVIGILPSDETGLAPPPGYPNPWVEIPIRTHLPARGDGGGDRDSRNHINILSSRVVVALPGGSGTASEVRLALEYGTPLLAFLHAPHDIPGLPDSVRWTDRLENVQEFVLAAL